MPASIHLTVAAIIHRNGDYLMVTEIVDGTSVLNQPAGHIEPGESALEAVCREALEETGWEVTPVHCLGLACYTAPNGGTYHRYNFLCEPIAERSDQLDPDIEARLWLPAAAILDTSYRHRSPMVRGAIEDHRAGLGFPLALLRDYRQLR